MSLDSLSAPPPGDDLRKRLSAAYALADRASAGGVLPYLQHVSINSAPDPKPFREVARDWQWALCVKLAPLFESVSRIRTDVKGPFKHWYEFARGHDKSGTIARLTNHALAYSRRPWVGYLAGGDRDQAGYLMESMETEARLNPWLHARLSFKNWTVRGSSDSVLHVVAADAASIHGVRPDLLLVDECTNWPDRVEPFFSALMSLADKRPDCAVVNICNSGRQLSWQWRVREAVRTSPDWYFYHAPGRLPSWMDEARVAESRRLLPPSEARRLFDNVWTSSEDDDGFVTRAEAQACEDLGVSLGLLPNAPPSPGVEYVGSIDYGPVKDRTVLCLLHRRPDGLLAVDRMEVWQGSRQSPVQISMIERWIDDVRRAYPLSALVVDPYQMESVCQRYEGLVPILRWEARGGRANYEMAQNLRALVVNRKIAWPARCGDLPSGHGAHTLVDELSELYVKVLGYGWRMEHYPGCHDDRAVALAMAALQAVKSQQRKPLYLSPLFF